MPRQRCRCVWGKAGLLVHQGLCSTLPGDALAGSWIAVESACLTCCPPLWQPCSAVRSYGAWWLRPRRSRRAAAPQHSSSRRGRWQLHRPLARRLRRVWQRCRSGWQGCGAAARSLQARCGCVPALHCWPARRHWLGDLTPVKCCALYRLFVMFYGYYCLLVDERTRIQLV